MAPMSPDEQRKAYLNLQSGGEAPAQGFRKPAPEKKKGILNFVRFYMKKKKKIKQKAKNIFFIN